MTFGNSIKIPPFGGILDNFGQFVSAGSGIGTLY
jgi:hypothetical protein